MTDGPALSGPPERYPFRLGAALPGTLHGVAAVLFDMDGTLVDAPYRWPEIRRRLGVEGLSIIDALHALPEQERAARWRELEAIEREASDRAVLHDGARELVEAFRAAGLPTAIVTNNTLENTLPLLDRFGLEMDLVLTRDSGLHKPSGAPFREAARRLGVPVRACLAVGDSRHDLQAAREAGVGTVCLVHTTDSRLIGQADLHFPDIPAFLRHLRTT